MDMEFEPGSKQPHMCSHEMTVMQVIRIQPNESIYLKINNKVPGLGLNLDVQKLDLSYKTRYNKHLPDAYERLILDVIHGDKRLFIRNDELEAAWDLFTPILKVCLACACELLQCAYLEKGLLASWRSDSPRTAKWSQALQQWQCMLKAFQKRLIGRYKLSLAQ